MANFNSVFQFRIAEALREASDKLEKLELRAREGIAIVGIGCRFPGGVRDVDGFWRILENGVDAIIDVPRDRWDADYYYSKDAATPGKIVSRYGGFIDEVDQFDPGFFGISAREALSMDPQQRLLLEIAWEALEDAAPVWKDLAHSRTGVFVGITNNDYARILASAGGLDKLDAHFLTGNALNAAAGRISYQLGLSGPSLTIDTACSSSLVSVHLACQSLRAGESDLALAGGVNLILSPEASIATSQARMLAPDGRCKTFDAAADGYVRSEGCAMVVLCRLSDAIIRRYRILGVLRGSAVNQNGVTSGFTVPSGTAQHELISEALSTSGLSPNDIDYLEAHGTGTPLGDPIEINALAKTFGPSRMKGSPLIVGSVKTNIGHSESAAGIAGLLKACMAVHHGRIPPSLHLTKPNPHIAWGSIPIKICTTGCNWPRAEGVRRAGVSSFGASGTNAHVIVEQKPFSVPKEQPFTGERANHVLTLSSPAANSLQDLGLDMADFLEQTSSAFVDICFTSNVGRRRSSYGIAVVAGSKAEAAIKLREELRRLASQSEPQRRPPLQRNPSVAYWLPNLDEIDLRQSRALYRAEPAFHRALDEAAAVLQIEASEPWLVAVRGAEGESHAPVTKGAAFCISNALCQIWSGWGVKLGEVIVGDNVSRLVAACQVGSLGLENVRKVWRFVEAEFQEVEWDKVFQEGGMLRSALLPVYCRWNGCDLTDNIRTYKYWKHSEWSSLSCNGSRSEATAPRLALRLSGGSRDESGSSQTAANSISSEAVFGVGLNIAEALAVMYRAGVKVDWDAVDRGFVRSRVALPRSRMSRRRFWPQVPAHGFLRSTATLSLLIDRVFRFPEQHVTIAEGNTEGAMRRFYFDCEVNGQVAVADACYLAMCIEAQSTILGGLACQLVGVELMPKLVLMQRDCRSLRLTLSERPGMGREFRITSFEQDEYSEARDTKLHATGTLLDAAQGTLPPIVLGAICRRCGEAITQEIFYDDLGCRLKVKWTGSMRWVNSVWKGRGEALAKLSRQEPAKGGIFHPGLIASCLQVFTATADLQESVFSTVTIERLIVHAKPDTEGELWVHAQLENGTGTKPGGIKGNVSLTDSNGAVLLEFQCIELRLNEPETPRQVQVSPDATAGEHVLALEWRKQSLIGNERTIPNESMGETYAITDNEMDVAGSSLRFGRLASVAGRHTLVEQTVLEIDPFSYEDFLRLQPLLRDTRRTRVIFAWRGEKLHEFDDPSALERIERALAGLFHLSRALRSFGSQVELFIVTRNAQAVPGFHEEVEPGQSALSGLGLVLQRECPALHIRLLDDDGVLPLSELVTRMAGFNSVEAQALRGGEIFSPRIVPQPENAQVPVLLDPQAWYIVTGGFGALGGVVARKLAEGGARNIALIGRHPTTSEGEAIVAELTRQGVRVNAASVDVADQVQVGTFFDDLALSGLPVKGVVHAAGVVADQRIEHQTWSEFSKVLAPKIRGAWNLHGATATMGLDFFMLFSSASTLFGLPGQSAYAAGNGFMDGLAHARSGWGLPAQTLNWGPWDAIGMAARLDRTVLSTYERFGVSLLPVADGAAYFAGILGNTKIRQAIIVRLHTSRMLQISMPLLSELIAPVGTETPKRALLEKLLALPPMAREAEVVQYCCGAIAQILQQDVAEVTSDLALSMLGLDSLMALEFVSAIKADYGVEIPIGTLLADGTIQYIASFVNQEITRTSGATTTDADFIAAGEGSGSLLDRLQDFDDDQIDDLWKQMNIEAPTAMPSEPKEFL